MEDKAAYRGHGQPHRLSFPAEAAVSLLLVRTRTPRLAGEWRGMVLLYPVWDSHRGEFRHKEGIEGGGNLVPEAPGACPAAADCGVEMAYTEQVEHGQSVWDRWLSEW